MGSEADDCKMKPGQQVNGRFEIVRKLGEGAFGAVYEAYDLQAKAKGPNKALKLESVNSRDQVLTLEVAVLSALQGTKHACRMYACGRNDKFSFMLMSLLGPSLSVLRRRQHDQKFALQTATYVTLQCLQAVRDMHKCGWLHRDVKPSNFAIGGPLEESKKFIYIFDFGLSRSFKYSNGSLRTPRKKVGFRGTLRYCSINGHTGKDLGRHDDLIGVLYMMIEMVKGCLPWKDLNKNKEVLQSKKSDIAGLYEMMPPRLLTVHEYLHTLRYEDKPKYIMLEDTLRNVIKEKKYQGNRMDWEDIISDDKEAEKNVVNDEKEGVVSDDKEAGAMQVLVSNLRST